MNKEEQGSLQKRIYLKDYLEKSSVLSSSYLHKNASGLATPKLLACSQTDVFNKLHSEQNLGFRLGEVDQGHDSANLIHSWRTCVRCKASNQDFGWSSLRMYAKFLAANPAASTNQYI